jgi:hypothetical protein
MTTPLHGRLITSMRLVKTTSGITANGVPNESTT